MKRSLLVLAGSFFFMLAGCPGGPVTTADGPVSTVDLAGGGGPDGGPGGGGDGGNTGPTLCKGAGCVGAACTQDSDCKEGKAGVNKVCWTQNILNNARYVTVPGGYCSQACTTDADCGTGFCFNFPTDKVSFCMARCRDANTCRHPGFACTFEGGVGQDGVCYPDANLTCDPTMGTCDAVVDNGVTAKGGCIRDAYENKGICRVACQVGTSTCPADLRFGTQNAPAQHCVFLDTTTDSAGRPSPFGDKWKGAVCMEYASPQIQPGAACTYWDQCTDGYQCDRYALPESKQVCRQLCVQGTTTQDSSVYVPAGAMPYKGCTSTSEGCANALQAGAMMGQIGLCEPK